MGKILIIKGADFSAVSIKQVTPITDKININVIASTIDGGTVTGTGSYNEGSAVKITAIPKKGYKFVKWNDNNTEATRIVVATLSITYVAIFEKLQYYYLYDKTDWESHFTDEGLNTTPCGLSGKSLIYGLMPAVDGIKLNIVSGCKINTNVENLGIVVAYKLTPTEIIKIAETNIIANANVEFDFNFDKDVIFTENDYLLICAKDIRWLKYVPNVLPYKLYQFTENSTPETIHTPHIKSYNNWCSLLPYKLV